MAGGRAGEENEVADLENPGGVAAVIEGGARPLAGRDSVSGMGVNSFKMVDEGEDGRGDDRDGGGGG